MGLMDELRNLPDNNLGGTSKEFIDADTLVDRESGERYRLTGINAAETDKVLDGKISEGTLGGNETTGIVHGLANKEGFTSTRPLLNPDGTPQRDPFGRIISDLVNPETGESFSQKMLNAGALDVNKYTSEQQRLARDIAQSEQDQARLDGTYTDTAFDNAATLIKQATAENLQGDMRFKQTALNEVQRQAYEQAGYGHYLTDDVQIRNYDRSLDNKSLNPFSDSWDQGWKNVSMGAAGVLNMLGEETGWEAAAQAGEDIIARKEAQLADYGTTVLDYKEVDSIGSAFEYLGNNLALSLPQMGVTAAAVAASPFTAGASLSAPAALYAGQTWNEMEGEKSASVAIGAGIAQATLDMLGLKIATKGLGGKDILNKAVSELTKKGMTKEVAEETVAKASRRQIAEFTGAAAEHAKKQLAAKELGMNMLKSIGVGGVGEAATEMTQESIGYLAAVGGSDKEFDWNDLNNRLISAAIAGGTLGGALSSGSTVYDAGAWADVAYRTAPADAEKASDAEIYAQEEKDRFGRIQSIEEIVADAGSRANTSPGLTLDERTQLYQADQKKKSLGDKITEEALNVSQLWQGATRNIFTPDLKRKSRAARMLADTFGGSLQRTFSGSNFESSKFHKVAVYKNMVPDPKTFYINQKGHGHVTSRDKSRISQDFYKQMNAAINKDGKFDPSLVKEGPNKQNIINMAKQMNELSDRMFQDQKKYSDDLGYVDNYLMKYKSVDKGAIAKDKTNFISALEKNGYSRDEAYKLTEEILDNNEVNDIDEAFSVTKGGIVPTSHKKRALGMSEKAEFQDFMNQDIFANISAAAKSAARFTAHRQYIGKNGAVVSKLLDDMVAEGVPQAEVNKVAARMKDYLDAESGNYKRPTSELGKNAIRFQKSFMMLTTMASLPLATISSLVETMLINRGLRSDQIFGGEGSLQHTFKELGNTLWAATKEIATVGRGGEVKKTPAQQQLKELGFYEWDVGAATVTGVTEVNSWQQYILQDFFKWTGLTGFTDFTRAARVSIAGDYINDKLDTVATQRRAGADRTREVQEAEEHLRNMGIDVDQMTELYDLKNGNIPISPEQDAFIADQMREAMMNFVNEAIVLPQSANRPLIYQDPRFALFTQFQGFMSAFTANQIPKLWGEYVKRGTPAMKYNAFALMTTMIMMGFVSQHLKDLIKYSGKTPHLDNPEYVQRGIRASGLLGTGERILDQFFPLYDQASHGVGDWSWNQISGESPAIGYAEKLSKAGGALLKGETEEAVYRGLRSAPLLGPLTSLDEYLAQGLTGGGWKYNGDN